MKMIAKLFGCIYVIKFFKFLKFLFLSFLVLNCIENMCPFVEKKENEKSVVFSLTYKYKKPPTLFFQPLPTPPYYSNPPIISNYYNVQPPYYSNPSYYSEN